MSILRNSTTCDGAQELRKESTVAGSLSLLGAMIDELETKLGKLNDRLAPALSPEAGTPPCEKAPPRQIHCPLEGRILELIDRLDEQKDRVSSIINRIQV